MPPCVFLFDTAARGETLPLFAEALLAALSAADPKGTTNCQLRFGLPLLTTAAQRTTAVHSDGSGGGGRTISFAPDTYKFVVWDFLDSLCEGWSTIDSARGYEIFFRDTAECVTLTELDEHIRQVVDRSLSRTGSYVGAFALDVGNPIHFLAFTNGLTYAAAIVDGSVIQELSPEGDRDWAVQGAASFKPGGLVWRPDGWLVENGPKNLAAAAPSVRGARSASTWKQKHAGRIEHRVIDAIQRALGIEANGRSYAFTVAGANDDVLQALMPEGKFTKYLFNAEHTKGAARHKYFTETLGIQPDDWRFLAAQFYDGLLLAELEDIYLNTWVNGYGLDFNTYMRIQGRRGEEANVRTGWQMQPGKLPSLTTAVPADAQRKVVKPPIPPILRSGSSNDADWAQLWAWINEAGARAIAKAIPTPMLFEGFPPILEGKSGRSAIRIRDARHGFCQWLLAHGHGEVHIHSCVIVSSPSSTQSLERVVAWAQAGARVLELNGLHAEITQFAT